MPRNLRIGTPEILELGFRDHRVGEKTPHTAQLRRIGQFFLPKTQHGLRDFLLRGSFPHYFLQTLVFQTRSGPFAQRENYRPHQPAILSFKTAGTVSVTAFALRNLLEFHRTQIQDFHPVNHLRDFLAVCPHVLYHGSPYRSRNAGKVFNAPPCLINRIPHEFRPILPCLHPYFRSFLKIGFRPDPFVGQTNHQSRKIADEQRIASSPQPELGQFPVFRVCQQIQHVFLAFHLGIIPALQLAAHRMQPLQGFVFSDIHLSSSFRPATPRSATCHMHYFFETNFSFRYLPV